MQKKQSISMEQLGNYLHQLIDTNPHTIMSVEDLTYHVGNLKNGLIQDGSNSFTFHTVLHMAQIRVKNHQFIDKENAQPYYSKQFAQWLLLNLYAYQVEHVN